MDSDNKKLFLSIALLIIVVIVIGVLYTRRPVVAPVITNTNTASTTAAVMYRNDEYGFSLSLPQTWTGYTVSSSTWNGDTSGDTGEQTITSGPIILIRHPQWTQANPRQDIPIMVFTIPQWNELQADTYHIGAAPIGPTELGSNSMYIFALPARYNYAYQTGWEEVDQIVTNNSNFSFYDPTQ